MAITVERIDAITELATRLFAEGAGRDAVAKAVREAHPDLSNVTSAHESMMTEEPYREEERFYLFLVDNANHCWVITRNPETATGIVIAEREEDDA